MEEYVYRIRKYLPLSFADEESNEFIKYLVDSYLENLKNKKYQFAFKAFHMLYMTFVYKLNWFLKKINNEKYEEKTYKIKVNNNGQAKLIENNIYINKIFEFSLLSETETIQKLLTKTGFHPNDFDKCQKHVEARNHCSHASGKIEYYEKGIDFLVEDELKYVQRLQKKVKPDLKKSIEDFLEDNWRKKLVGKDIRNWFEENHFSENDLKIFVDLDLPIMSKKSNSETILFKKIIYLKIIFEIQKIIELEDVQNFFLDKLKALHFGLEDEITINIDGEKKIIQTIRILEENIFPILSELSKEDRDAAEDFFIDEDIWASMAREKINNILENAQWNDIDNTVLLEINEESPDYKEITCYEDLINELIRIGDEEAGNYFPLDSEMREIMTSNFSSDGIVENALEDYEDELINLGWI